MKWSSLLLIPDPTKRLAPFERARYPMTNGDETRRDLTGISSRAAIADGSHEGATAFDPGEDQNQASRST
jgi:hypothetical protein